jgi:hypothetical protein
MFCLPKHLTARVRQAVQDFAPPLIVAHMPTAIAGRRPSHAAFGGPRTEKPSGDRTSAVSLSTYILPVGAVFRVAVLLPKLSHGSRERLYSPPATDGEA